jgi:uncharacterized protein YndB with AHSA1/START domain
MTLTIAPVRKQITVDAPIERAFAVFTDGFATWWPLSSHHLLDVDAETAVIEPHTGGRLYERAVDGRECTWGHVREWDPPNRFVFSWEINGDFQPDPNMTSEVEVRFVAESPTRTRVELEHRNLEAFGERGDEMRGVFDSDGGWGGLLEHFAEAASRAA